MGRCNPVIMPYMRLISQARKIWENVIIVNSNISFFYLLIFYVFSVTHRQSIFVTKGKKIDLPWVVGKKWRPPPRVGGGYSIYPWVGRCGAAPHTLTLFKTNIADFPTLFKTEFWFLIPSLRHLSCLRQKLINRYPD